MKKKEKNIKISKRKKIILIASILALIIGIIFLINYLSPIKDISKDTLNIKLSTEKIIGDNVIVNLNTTTKYDIYYYIDLKDEEEENLDIESNDYYEEKLNNENITNSSTNTSSSKNDIKQIANNEYKKSNGKITVENNATIYLKYGKFNKLSKNVYTFEINNIDKQGPEIGEIETSCTDSSIAVTITAIDMGNPKLKYYFKLADDEKFICTEEINHYTFTNLEKEKTYTIYVKVEDGFGNKTEVATDAIASSKSMSASKKIYYIKVNLATNTVTIYDKDDDGEYSNPIKAMICSTGKATPKSGKYKISYRYRWLALFGNVYGQYAVRIHGNILFHSVPYLQTYPDTLEYEEFDKLGTSASAGCIRLMVKDCKWIYDNVDTGSIVEFYSDSSNPGPLGKPSAPKISSNTKNRDWDPTDPDERNPWTRRKWNCS